MSPPLSRLFYAVIFSIMRRCHLVRLKQKNVLKSTISALVFTFLWITTPAAALEVAASIRPLQSLAAAVMQGVGTPALIVQGAGSPHAYALRPDDARTIAKADIIFWIGPEFETFLIKPLATISKHDAINIPLNTTPGLKLLHKREGGTFEPHHDHDDDKTTHNHNSTDDHLDLHFWLDPQNAILMVDSIAKELSEKDPKNAEKYQTNAEAYKQRLKTLIDETQAKLAPVKNKPFIVFHDAYHYFENRFNIMAAGSVTINPEHLPSVQRIRALQERMSSLHVVCLFSEPQFQSGLVDTLKEGTTIKTGVLDPLGYDIPTGPEQYILLIKKLTDSIVGCLR